MAKQQRDRSNNWTIEETILLIDEAEQSLAILRSKFNSSLHLSEKKKKWSEITSKINALGVQTRTVEQVKSKWNNLNREAKKTFTETRKEQKMTGGGPTPASLSTTTETLIQLNKDSPSFSGICGGFSTSVFHKDHATLTVSNNIQKVQTNLVEDLTSHIDGASSSTSHSPDVGKSNEIFTVHVVNSSADSDEQPGNDTYKEMEAVCVGEQKKKRRKVSMEDLHNIQYEVLQKESLLLDVRREHYILQNEKLRLEVSSLKQ